MSNQVRGFQPGPTVTQNVAVTGTAASITLNNTAGTRAARIVNAGTTTIFAAFDTTATTTQGMVILGNTREVITLPQQCSFISFVATAAAGTAYVTIGNGS